MTDIVKLDEWEAYEAIIAMSEAVANEIEDREKVKLPKIVLDWVDEVKEFSIENEYPATMAYFVGLGQILKDCVRVAIMGTPLDTRIHFCWIQTARTGKTTMFDFLQPTWEHLFDVVNDFPLTEQYRDIWDKQRGTLGGVNKFNIQNPDAFTDQALLGTIEKDAEKNELWSDEENAVNIDTDGNAIPEFVDKYINGALFGSGVIAFDEFEHSGIFKESAHKKDTVMMFQKFMNKLDSDTHLIKKRLTNWGMDLEVDCQRSLWATTLPPQGLEVVILTKGVFQRMWLYVRDIPPSLKEKMEDKYLDTIGVIDDSYGGINPVFAEQAEKIFDIYVWVQQRLAEVGDKRKISMINSDARNRLRTINKGMRKYMRNFSGVMYEALDSFRMNTINNMCIAATLCAISEKSPVVLPRHVDQAKVLTDKSFDSITEWFSNKLKGGNTRVQSKQVEGVVINVYEGCLKTEKSSLSSDGWISKTQLIQNYMKNTKKARATFYRLWNSTEHLFEQRTINRKVYIRRIKNES